MGSGRAVCGLQGLGGRERSGRTQADYGFVAAKKGEPSLNAKFPLWCYLFASWYSLMKSATQIAQVM